MNRHTLLSLSLASVLVAAFVACGSSDDDPAPSGPTNFQTGGTSGAAGSTTGGAGGSTAGAGGSTAGAGGSTAGAGGSTAGAGGSTAGAGGSTAGAGGSSGGAAGCATQPKVTEEFLNRCTSSACAPFDNVARLPLFQGGKLPPIQ